MSVNFKPGSIESCLENWLEMFMNERLFAFKGTCGEGQSELHAVIRESQAALKKLTPQKETD